jgi:hypothetical protein
MSELMVWQRLRPGGASMQARSMFRAKVPGGWIVRDGDNSSATVQTFFLPDPESAWDPELLPSDP